MMRKVTNNDSNDDTIDWLTINGSDNDFSLVPGQIQAIIWTNAGILLIEPWEQTSVKF